MKSVYVTIPNQHWIHTAVARVMMLLLQDGRYRVHIEQPAHKPYVNNLHHCVREFVNREDDYWLNIDADNPPINNPLDLVELDLDLVGLPTPIWHFEGRPGERPIYLSAYDYDGETDAYREHQPHEGLQRVDAVGTGCFMVARGVINHKGVCPYRNQGGFHRTWNDDGTMEKGNDIAFCERVRRAGFNIHAHYDYQCDHFSELSLRETARAMGYARAE